MSRISRLFELIKALRARRMPVTASQLAPELSVSLRTVYRDIETLRSLGAPVEGEAGVGFRLKDGFFLPELAFSPDEMDALLLGLNWVRQRADPALARAAEGALAKLLSACGDAAPETPEAPGLISAGSAVERADLPQVAQLREAIRRQRKVTIAYENAQGSRSERVVWPFAIVYFDDVRVLAAWCEQRSAFRHFRVDRMVIRMMLEERYPGRRPALMAQWRRQDRDWRSILTVPDTTSS